MKGVIALLVLIAISAGVFALGTLRRKSDGKPLLHVADEVALKVNVAKPQRGDIIRLAQAPGDVEAVLDVDISSEIFAKIEEMLVEEGDMVKKGDLLCRLDDKHLRADVESAVERIAQLAAAIIQADADVEKAERDCERQKRLSESHATSHLELLDTMTIRKKARAGLDIRRHELAQAQANLTRLREDLKRTIIESPIDGVVSVLNAKQGEVVITGTMNNPGTVIMTITDLSKMQVLARVDEVEVPLVKPGQRARVYLQSDPDRPVPARVIRVASKGTKPAGRDVVTFEAVLEILSDDDRIKPGMTANVEIEVATQRNAITVPVEAVVHCMRKELDEKIVEAYDKTQSDLDLSQRARQAQYIKVVYVKVGDVARVRLIRAGIADSQRVEVCEGLAADEEVIIGPYRSLDQLKDGKKVVLAEPDKKEGADLPGTDTKVDDEQQADDDDPGSDDGERQTEEDESGDAGEEDEQTLAASATP